MLSPVTIAGIYVVLGALWILFSDRLLADYIHDSSVLTRFQTYKGWFYVIATGLLLYFLVSRYRKELDRERVSLAESEAKYRLLFDSMTDAYAKVDMSGRILGFNRAFLDMTGYDEATLSLLTYKDLTPLKWHKEEAMIIAEQVVPKGCSEVYEKEYIRKDGAVIPVELRTFLIRASDGTPAALWAIVRDITKRKRAEAVRTTELQILEMISRDAALPEVLEKIVLSVESVSRETIASVLLLDPDGIHMRNGAAPNLPEAYIQALEGEAIGPSVESCGTAAYRREPVIVSDIETDPLWAGYRELARSYGLRACWATPIISSQGRVLGVFAMYYRESRTPRKEDFALIERATHMAGIAIERRRTEEALQESERFGRNIIDSLQVNIAVVDKNGVIYKVNRAWEDFARENAEGKTVSARAGDNYFEVCRKAQGPFSEEAASALRGLEAILAGHVGCFDLEYPCHSPVEKRWFLMHAVPLQTKTGGLVISHINISGVKEAEEALQEKEHLLSESQRIAHIGSWSWDLSGPIKWTEETYRIYGVSPETFTPTIESLVNLLHPEDRPAMQRWLELCGTGQSPDDLEFRVILSDGSVRILSGRGELMYGTDNGPVHMTGTVQDITERKIMDLELKKHRDGLEDLVRERTRELERSQQALQYLLEDVKEANARLKELDRLKSLFIASMSHELRTPLNSIIGFTGILLQGLAGPMNEEQKKQLGMVKSSSVHLLSLITDIIDLSKIEAGKVDISIDRFDLAETAREVLASFVPPAERKGLAMEIDAPHTLPVMSDARRVRQVLMNLVGNAVKFTDHGGVRVRLTEKDGVAEVSVIDAGAGIREDDMDKLFRTFSQVTSSEMPKHEGTGLGLYLSKKLITLLGGEIEAESEYGRGSVFRFRLPLERGGGK